MAVRYEMRLSKQATIGKCDCCIRKATRTYKIFNIHGREVGIVKACSTDCGFGAGKKALQDYHKYILKTNPEIKLTLGTSLTF